MKISIIGIRGIPVIYSGFESFAESLAVYLAKKKYKVYLYCRSPYIDTTKKQYKNANLISIPTLKSKNLESFIHSFLSTIHTIIFIRPKIIYYLGVGNAIFTLIPKLFGIKTLINVDGLDWRRRKWSKIVSFYLRISQYLATILPSTTITDSLYMKHYYLAHYGKKTKYIPYGFDEKLLTLGKNLEGKIFKKYKIEKHKYFVWVGRIVPDNYLEELIYAFKKLKTNFNCLIIGDDIYRSSYKKDILNIAKIDKRIIFTGFVSKKNVHFLFGMLIVILRLNVQEEPIRH
jgi:glycosyltransferase involved in cell wall biosynthesis